MMKNIAVVKMTPNLFRDMFFPIATEILSVDFDGQNDQYISVLVEHPVLPSREKGMSSDWWIRDMFDGKDKKLPPEYPGEPTQAWIDGWNAGMEGSTIDENPYSPMTSEWFDWRYGWEAANYD